MKKHFVRLTLFLTAIFLALVLTVINNRLGEPEFAVRHVQKIIDREESAAEKIFQKVQTETEITPYIFEGISNRMIHERGFHAFLFYNSTLTYWSDNTIPVEKDDLLNIKRDTLFYTGNLVSYCKYYTWNNHQLYLLTPVKQNFNYENQYLKNTFPKKFRLHSSTQISLDSTIGLPVSNSSGEFMYSLVFSDSRYSFPGFQIAITICYFLALIFLALLMLELYRILPPFKDRQLLRVLMYGVDMALLWIILQWIGVPGYLAETKLFDPALFAHNNFISSMGELLIVTTLLFFTGYAWFTGLKVETDRGPAKHVGNIIISAALIAFVIITIRFSLVLIYSLVVNSTISFDLTSLFDLNIYSIIGFLIMVLLLAGSWMMMISLTRYLMGACKKRLNYLIIIGVILVLFLLGGIINPGTYPLIIIISTAVFVVFCTLEYYFHEDKIDPGMAVLVIIMLSMISGVILNHAVSEERDSGMRMMAMSVSNQRDRIAEYLFEESVDEMTGDPRLQYLARRAVYNSDREDELKTYILENYLTGYWKQFDYQVTACDRFVDLSFDNQGAVMNCSDYFGGILERFGVETFGEHLYFINDSSGLVSYLGKIPLPAPEENMEPVTLFIDIIPKYVQEGLGYPELMIDGQFESPTDYSGYSWAMFINGSLVRNVGDYFYSSKLARYVETEEKDIFLKHNEWYHFLYHAGEGMTIMISRPSGMLIDSIAPFSYLFLFISMVVLALYGIYIISRRDKVFKFTTRNRIQLFVTGFLFFSLAVVGYSSVRYILVLNNDKNRENLQEKAHSVLTELEHKLSNEPGFNEELYDYLSSLFTKWSNVFFSDINLYNPGGDLLVSSRREIFDENLTSRRMDASAYKALALDRKTQFICKEKIGNYSYLSAWVQFRNAENDLVAYLNLPFFARQSELSREVSVFLMTFINIYVLLIVIALLIGLLLSNIISKPLERIREKMARLSLGGDNEKLEWFRDDEIGALVREYNEKVDELALNAEKLAQTERETAWREMARQVAHEIKNPLTPMKLSVQYLKRAWDDNAPDFDQRVKRFSDTMIEQIDSMAEIATAFSDFARMPKAQLEAIKLNELLKSSISLFDDSPDIRIELNLSDQDTTIFADNKQLIRVFNNLMKNSLQALEGSRDGHIRVQTWREEDTVMVLFADNGPGIPSEQTEKIFAPNFTTKSGGMGLGLAMVKNIVLNHGGQIWFESNGETVFYISLPIFRG